MDSISNGHNGKPCNKKSKWVVPISEAAENTENPIRRIVDTMKIEPNPKYDFISVSIGKLSKSLKVAELKRVLDGD